MQLHGWLQEYAATLLQLIFPSLGLPRSWTAVITCKISFVSTQITVE